MKQVRVLLVIAQLDTGGAEVQLVRLAIGLAAEGFAPEVAVFYPGGHLEPTLVEAGIRVHHLRRSTKLGIETILHLRRILRNGKYEIVHSSLWPANWRTRLAALMAGRPITVCAPESVDTWMRFHHVALDRFLAHWGTDAIVANAQAVRDYLVRREKVSQKLIRVIPNGLDTTGLSNLPDRVQARRMVGLPFEPPVALILGNLRPEKNHEDFLRMAALVRRRRPDALFVVVGDGKRRAALEEMSAGLGLRDAVRWAGHQRDVGPWLAASDVTLNTSHREGLCNAILESMAAARPVVAYAVGGNSELVRNGRTGRLAAPGQVGQLADAVLDYIEDPDLARRDGEEGARATAERFSIETMVRRTADLYRELLEKGRPRQDGSKLAGTEQHSA